MIKRLPAVAGALAALLTGATGSVAAAAEIRQLEVHKEARRYFVKTESWIDAPVDAVFDVLTDYERYERVSPVFEESHFLERNADGSGIVYTRAYGCVLFLCRTIERVEQLELVHDEEILATVIPERSDTPFGIARWKLSAVDGGTRLHYDLTMEPGFWVPPLIGPLVLKKALAKGGAQAVRSVERAAQDAAFAGL